VVGAVEQWVGRLHDENVGQKQYYNHLPTYQSTPLCHGRHALGLHRADPFPPYFAGRLPRTARANPFTKGTSTGSFALPPRNWKSMTPTNSTSTVWKKIRLVMGCGGCGGGAAECLDQFPRPIEAPRSSRNKAHLIVREWRVLIRLLHLPPLLSFHQVVHGGQVLSESEQVGVVSGPVCGGGSAGRMKRGDTNAEWLRQRYQTTIKQQRQ